MRSGHKAPPAWPHALILLSPESTALNYNVCCPNYTSLSRHLNSNLIHRQTIWSSLSVMIWWTRNLFIILILGRANITSKGPWYYGRFHWFEILILSWSRFDKWGSKSAGQTEESFFPFAAFVCTNFLLLFIPPGRMAKLLILEMTLANSASAAAMNRG